MGSYMLQLSVFQGPYSRFLLCMANTLLLVRAYGPESWVHSTGCQPTLVRGSEGLVNYTGACRLSTANCMKK